jgi:hypothetical protein
LEGKHAKERINKKNTYSVGCGRHYRNYFIYYPSIKTYSLIRVIDIWMSTHPKDAGT